MEVKEIVGYKRESFKKKDLKDIRSQGNVPGVLYGGKIHKNFIIPYFLLQDIVYTNKKYLLKFNLDGEIYDCILKDIQFHPVSDIILHIDLLEVDNKKKIVESLNIEKQGIPIGVKNGGLLLQKKKKIIIRGFANSIPSVINIDISNLDGGDTFRVNNLPAIEGCEYLDNSKDQIFSLKAPRTSSN